MATTLDERRQKPTPRPAAAMDLGSVDGAAPLNLTPPGTMRPDTPAPVPTQPAPQFTRTNAGPMLAQPPAAPVAPAVDPQQQRLANQTAMYVQGAQAAAAARPQTPAQQMVDAPMSAPVRNSINAAVANPQPSLGTAIDTRPRLFDPATARPAAAASVVSAANAAPTGPAPAAVPAQPGEYGRQMGNVGQFFGDAIKTLVSAPGYGMSKDNPTAAPVAPGVIGPRSNLEAQAKNPASDQGQARTMGTGDARRQAGDYDRTRVATPPAPPAPPAQPDNNGFTKVGDNIYRKGNTFTDEAGTRDTAFLNRGPVSAQNMQAADQLAANYNSNQQALARLQANNAAAQPRGFAPQQQPRQFDRAASIKAMTDLTSPEYRALRALRMEAESEAKANARLGRAGRGNNGAAQAYAALIAELTGGTRQGQVAEMQDGTNRYTADRREEGATQRALIGEEGATRRAGMTNDLAADRLEMDKEQASINIQKARQLQKAQEEYLNETDPAKREAKARTLQALMGKGDGVPAGKDRYITMGGGQEYDPKGGLINRPQEVFDTVTGQRVGAPAAPAQLPPKDKLVKGVVYDTPKGRGTWDGKNFIPVQQ